jgi:NTP pyrophosphatase (non-canonical NTP hydrolase)
MDKVRILLKTAEESGELTQAVIKHHLHGERGTQQNLTNEAGDVLAFIHFMVEQGIINKKQLKAAKKARLLRERNK